MSITYKWVCGFHYASVNLCPLTFFCHWCVGCWRTVMDVQVYQSSRSRLRSVQQRSAHVSKEQVFILPQPASFRLWNITFLCHFGQSLHLQPSVSVSCPLGALSLSVSSTVSPINYSSFSPSSSQMSFAKPSILHFPLCVFSQLSLLVAVVSNATSTVSN